MDDAMRSFDGVLIEKPTNVVALLGKVILIPIIALFSNNHSGEDFLRATKL